jgi:hypothetical protein
MLKINHDISMMATQKKKNNGLNKEVGERKLNNKSLSHEELGMW